MAGPWDTFFTTEVTVAAGLTGLVFVALSINLGSIIASGSLVARAAEALVLLVQPVLLGLIVLAPGGRRASGAALCAVAGVFVAGLVALLVQGRPRSSEDHRMLQFRVRAVVVLATMGTILAGSVLLTTGDGGAYGWIGFGALAGMTIGIVDAWVLLVEILR